jgi:hypothetical protein
MAGNRFLDGVDRSVSSVKSTASRGTPGYYLSGMSNEQSDFRD